jgi:glucosyl-dolichyl phosphate glucuronosyltransferase
MEIGGGFHPIGYPDSCARRLQFNRARMTATFPLSATVLICTYNRAVRLEEMLSSLRDTKTSRAWSVIVVDNNSSDDTRRVTTTAAQDFPVPLQYVFESRQGKSYALNTGIERCTAEVIVFTDDDVRVGSGWLDAACEPLDQSPDLDYTGGPVFPIWDARPPFWLDQTRGDLWGTLAILDYGTTTFVFEERQRVPLGANMAVRRALIERIGGFHPELGRRGRSLLGQEQAEFLARAHAAAARGLYVPTMQVEHHVPAERLSKSYFRRWWYWKGVSRARVDQMHRRTELGLDLQRVPYIAKVPRYVWGQLPRGAWHWLLAVVRRDPRGAARHEMRAVFALGYIRACWRRDGQLEPAPLPVRPETASLSR